MPIFDADAVHDFYIRPRVHDVEADSQRCQLQWGVELRPLWANTVYGGVAGLKASSNIVFSNGNFDPWGPYGIWTSLSDSLIAIPIDEGGHHLDLMFSHPADPPSVRRAREQEKREIRKWIRARRSQK
jgi:lysosomal Pro-X carboxypeptidase